MTDFLPGYDDWKTREDDACEECGRAVAAPKHRREEHRTSCSSYQANDPDYEREARRDRAFEEDA